MKNLARCAVAAAMLAAAAAALAAPPAAPKPIVPVTHTDAEWKALLPSLSYQVLRHAATETAFTGRWWNEHRRGTFACAGCGLELFSSGTKFDSGTGWPSFWQPIAKQRVLVNADPSLGISRDEVRCARCAGHLGHVFDDGPAPTGLRYCMNSAALTFLPAK
jgi:peptide-methionine (R)-S-oxide reductase